MINLRKICLIIISSLTFLSCDTKKSVDFNKVIAIGETKDTVYQWCAIVPAETEYSYRIGEWKFLSQDSSVIANGQYRTYRNWIWDEGGCPYDYIENTIDLEDWEFWNLQGDKIEPNIELLKMIEFKIKDEENLKK